MKGVNIFLAEGFEETEAICTIDILRRGNIKVNVVSMNEGKEVKGSHDIRILADMSFEELCQNYSKQTSSEQDDKTNKNDLMIFPGGLPGTTNLAENEKLIALINQHYNEGGSLAAICAAPGLILPKLKILPEINFTCFDGFETELIAKGGKFAKVPAVCDKQIITGRSAGYVVDFAMKILEHLKTKESEGQKILDTESINKVKKGLLI